MDVIEDIVNIIHIILDWLGFDIRNVQIPASLWPNQHPHRSFIRKIAHYLPLPPAKRINIQSELLGRKYKVLHQRSSSTDSLLSLSPSLAYSEDFQWVEEELDDNYIRIRQQCQSNTNDFDQQSIDDRPFLAQGHHARTSTPLMDSFLSASLDPAAMQKISSLEDEVAVLRKQIAQLVVFQENINKSNAELTVTKTCASGCRMQHSLAPSASLVAVPNVIEHVTLSVPPPPPPPLPPPPPPPLPPSLSSLPPLPGLKLKTNKGGSFADLIKQNKGNLASRDETKESKQKSKGGDVPDMSEVLKGIGKVKLKQIERSPGGTPLRKKPEPSDDAASLIAAALKKKFANTKLASPEIDNKDISSGFSSPDSPLAPFGPHLLKKTTGLSKLLTDATHIVSKHEQEDSKNVTESSKLIDKVNRLSLSAIKEDSNSPLQEIVKTAMKQELDTYENVIVPNLDCHETKGSTNTSSSRSPQLHTTPQKNSKSTSKIRWSKSLFKENSASKVSPKQVFDVSSRPLKDSKMNACLKNTKEHLPETRKSVTTDDMKEHCRSPLKDLNVNRRHSLNEFSIKS